MSSNQLVSPTNPSSPTGISFPGKRNSKTMAVKQYSFGQKTMASIINALHKTRRNNNAFYKEEIKDNNNLDNCVYDLNEEQLLNLAITILSKNVNKRSVKDIKTLVKCTENVQFFKSFSGKGDNETHEQCCKYMMLRSQGVNSTVFEEGTIGSTFYIILKGTVGIYRREYLPSPNGEIFELKKIKSLEAGYSFGELALMEKRPRAATIICEEQCDFGVLEKKYFNQILKEKEEKKFYEQIAFFASMKLFNNWSFSAIKQIYLTAYQTEYKKNQIVYNENEDSEYIYVVKEGEFRMFKNFKLEVPIQDLKTQLKFFFNDSPKKNNLKPKTIELGIITVGESFGEEESLTNCPRFSTIMCSSLKGALYVMNKNEFLRKVFSDEVALKLLKDQIRNKVMFREQRIKNFIKISKDSEKEYLKTSQNIIDEKEGNDFVLPFSTTNLKADHKRTKSERISSSECILRPEKIINIVKNNKIIKNMVGGSVIKRVIRAKMIGDNEIKQKAKAEKDQSYYNISLFSSKKIKNLSFQTEKKVAPIQLNEIPNIPITNPNRHKRSKTVNGIVSFSFSSNLNVNENKKPLKKNNKSNDMNNFAKNNLLNNATLRRTSKDLRISIGVVENEEKNDKLNESKFKENDSLPLKYHAHELKDYLFRGLKRFITPNITFNSTSSSKFFNKTYV